MSLSELSERAKLSQVNAFVEYRIALFWFVAVFLVYLSFSPLAISGMGYMGENIEAAQRITANLWQWINGNVGQFVVNWPRHGAVEMLFEVPLLLLQPLLPIKSSDPADRLMSFQPILLTALTSAIFLKWSRRLTGDWKPAIAVTLAASFATMLWPYAYIGLETTQSFFLLLAGFLALNYEQPVAWPRTIALGLAAGVAASAKSNGLFLLPALGFLVCVYLWRDWRNYRALIGVLKQEWAKALCLILLIAAFYWVGSYSRALYWRQHGSLMDYVYRNVLIESPLTFALNLWGQFFSRNKGLVFFAPLAMVGLLVSRTSFRVAPQMTIFSWLVLAGSAGSLSLLVPWEDEVWGPRYLHSAVAPLILCLAAALRAVRPGLLEKTTLVAAATIGLAISCLGSLFYYGTLHRAASDAGQATLENFLNDPRFNHPHFNFKLLQSRFFSQEQQWPKPERWWFEKPPDAPDVRSVDLRDYAEPQPMILNPAKSYRLVTLMKGCLLLGITLLLWACFVVCRKRDG